VAGENADLAQHPPNGAAWVQGDLLLRFDAMLEGAQNTAHAVF